MILLKKSIAVCLILRPHKLRSGRAKSLKYVNSLAVGTSSSIAIYRDRLMNQKTFRSVKRSGRTAHLRLGIISQFWLPKFGGGEQYTYRLAKSLIRRGVDVQVFAGTEAQAGRDNGDIPVTRFAPRGNIEYAQWGELHTSENKSQQDQAFDKLFKMYDFMNAAVKWAKESNLEMVIVNHPLTQTFHYQTRELILQLQALAIKVGIIHFDNYQAVETYLGSHYVFHQPKGTEGWELAAQNCTVELLKNFLVYKKLEATYRIGSPLFFQPDFAISCSDWSQRFIDPLEEVKKIVVHPILDNGYWTTQLDAANQLQPVDILCINPNYRKGVDLMADLIRNAKKSWTFRVLKGGWGDSFKTFLPLIENSAAFLEGRVELLDYVSDVRYAYDACKLVFFPSLYEGYGMAAVEPVYRGVPVISSSYPAVLEATGTEAAILCPYKDLPFKWVDLVDEVLENRGPWIETGLKRVRDLDNRFEAEISCLENFLSDLE